MARIGALASVVPLLMLILACGQSVAQSGDRLEVELRIELEQEDREFGLEGYVARYDHQAVITLDRSTLDSKIMSTHWQGFEHCVDPPLEIEWESEIVFDDFDYAVPEVGVLVRGDDVWLLYHPAREFGVVHPGRPPCGSGDAIPLRSMVAKPFFHGDLQDGAEPISDHPVYVYDDSESWGGFVLAVVPLATLQNGETVPISASYELADDLLLIRMRVEGRLGLGQ